MRDQADGPWQDKNDSGTETIRKNGGGREFGRRELKAERGKRKCSLGNRMLTALELGKEKRIFRKEIDVKEKKDQDKNITRKKYDWSS